MPSQPQQALRVPRETLQLRPSQPLGTVFLPNHSTFLFNWGGLGPASGLGLAARLRHSIVALTLTRSPGFALHREHIV